MNLSGGPVSSCSRCGTLLSAAVADGLCTGCLTRAVFFSPEPPLTDAEEFPEAMERIGDYQLIERIARGGMGIVYRARQISLGREVAVKVLLDPIFASPEELSRFRAEAPAAAALHHPNIVAIHEIGEIDGRCFFSMDYVQGKDLAGLTREGPLTAKQAAETMLKIAEAVHHCHERGIVHRDLKPSNVLVDAQGEPRVTDFGLAKRIRPADGDSSNLTLTGQVIGTPGYMSPEQAAAKRDVGPATDIYSLGAILYHLLTARAPFVGERPTAVLRQVEDKDPVAPTLLNPAVPSDLETICLKCLNKEPSRRYLTCRELAQDLGRFLRHEPILARPIGPVERLARWTRRSPVVASLSALVALLLITVAVGSVISAHRVNNERLAEAALRQEAETRLRQGEGLINFMLGDLADRLEPLGKLDVLESTISQVSQFYEQIPADRLSAESQRNRANMFFQFGGIRASQGRLPEAYTNYQEAIAAYSALTTAYPTNLQWRFELSRTRNDLGIVFARRHDLTNAVSVLEQTLQERDALIKLAPTNVFWLASYGATALNLALMERRLGHLDRAGEYLDRADHDFRAWALTEPDSPTPRQRLAMVRGTAARVLLDRKQTNAAAAAFTEQVQILRGLVATAPGNTAIQADLMLGLSYLAELQIQQSNFEAALPNVNEGVQMGERLIAQDPANNEWLMYLITHLTDRGLVMKELKDPGAALKSFHRAWDISSPRLDVVRQYPEWLHNLQQAMEVGEQVEQESAVRARAEAKPDEAAVHEKAAVEFNRNRKSL